MRESLRIHYNSLIIDQDQIIDEWLSVEEAKTYLQELKDRVTDVEKAITEIERIEKRIKEIRKE